ncbi:MAG: metal-dependent transcriptional regulator [Chloroflexota bacterium]|nr:metal-dependent transcriptional regulator [Chloroflexota bacterium]
MVNHQHEHSVGEDPKVTPTVEEYLESIYNMTVDEGKPAIAARLAQRMGVSPVTVFDTVKRLKGEGRGDGFVIVDEKSKEITLTERGKEVALSLARRHRLTERLLVDVLGLDWEESHEEACRLEHSISPRLEEALTAFLGNPQTCPHGNPIPGSGAKIDPRAHPLNEIAAGSDIIVIRIGEEAEHEPGLLKYLQQYNFVPGVKFHVKGASPFNDVVTAINNEGREITLGVKTANKIWVLPVDH